MVRILHIIQVFNKYYRVLQWYPSFAILGDILVQFIKDDKGELQYIAHPYNSHPRSLAPSKTVCEASVGTTVSEEEELERLQVLKCSMRNDPTRTECHEIPFTPSDGKHLITTSKNM